MAEIRLTNTATRKKDTFVPIDPEDVKMYVCGPTVYDRAHLGNARPAVVFDVLFRLLRHKYGADHVTYVRNITDVDDKINAEALRRQEAGAQGSLEDLIRERSDETTRWYLEDMAALGVLPPTHSPRATEYIAQMVTMIEGLIAKGHAYAADGHVLFKVASYKDYGALSGRSVDDMIAGARVEVAPYKEDPMDFVLWKPSSDDLPGWDSPWGRGRPGWHIECSAMASELLGERFDIHGGGNDLMFPHHENEIAQSKCMGHGFANVWLHNEMLQVEGKKMSKSLGNFFTVRDLLEQGWPGEVIRFVMLSTHYRKPMDWTEKKAREARDTLHSWRLLADFECPSAVPTDVIGALADDLNSPSAIAKLDKLAREGDSAGLKAGANLLGLLHDADGEWSWNSRSLKQIAEIPEWHPAHSWREALFAPINRAFGQYREIAENISKPLQQSKFPLLDSLKNSTGFVKWMAEAHEEMTERFPDEYGAAYGEMPASLLNLRILESMKRAGVIELIAKRKAAKDNRDFELADEIRKNLEENGIALVDEKDGTKWAVAQDFDPSKLEALK